MRVAGRPGRRRSRRARAARRTCAARLPCRSAIPCSSIGSTIWSPIVLTGLNAFIAPWKTIAMSFQRCGLIVSSPPREDVLAVEEHPAGRRDAVGGSRPMSARIVVVLPQPDSPTSPSRSPSSSVEADALDGVQLAAARQVEPDVEVLDLEQDRRSRAHSPAAFAPAACTRKRLTERWPTRSRGLSASSTDWPIIVQARMTSVTQTPGGTIAHQALLIDRVARERVLDQPPPRDRARVAEAEERDERLGEDRERDHQDGVRDQERRHLRQDVLERSSRRLPAPSARARFT